MKNLGNLSPKEGSNKTVKRLGRGIGSGLGKTAGKGHKGQKARKSGGVRFGFEGGQTPLYRRIPKFGFVNPKMKKYHVINVGDLEIFNNGDVVDIAAVVAKGIIGKAKFPLKILANGSLSKKLTINADKVSAQAKTLIEKNGGSVSLIVKN